MLELVFTSAKAGLIPGRSGFCSVAWTEGMPQNLVSLLENMSGYNALYMPNDPKAELNPVCCSYQKVRYGQNELRILSRIAFAGLDYTGRTNKIAHHIIIEDDSELASLQHGPVSAFLCEENFITEWNEPPRLLPRRTRLKSATTAGLRAEQWHTLTGNPQWAGIVAERFLAGDEKSCLYLEYDNEIHRGNVLPLIDEIVRVLPPGAVADFTFNTYFTNAQNGIDCFFRAALPNSPALPAIKRFKAKDLISLVSLSEPPQDWNDSPMVGMAVDGVAPVPAVPVPEMQEMEEEQIEEEVVADLYRNPHAARSVPPQNQPEIYQPKYKAGKISYRKGAPQPKRTAARGGVPPQVRLMLFAGGALLLICLLGTGVWFASQMMKDRKTASAAKNEKDDHRDETETAQTGSVKDPAENAESGKVPGTDRGKNKMFPENTGESKPERNQRRKNIPAEKPKTQAEKPKTQEKRIQWTQRDAFELYKGFKTMIQKSTGTLQLPDVLHGVTEFRVELKPGWGRSVEISDENKSRKETKDSLKLHGNENSILLEIHLTDGEKLVFSGSKMNDLLEEYIQNITFIKADQKISWKYEFNKEFCKLILENGKFEVDGNRIKFNFAEEDKCVKSDFDVDEKKLIEGIAGDVRRYENALNKVREARKAYEEKKGNRSDKETALYTWEVAEKTLKSLTNELEKKDVTKINFTQVESLFKKFVEQLKNLDPEKEKKAFEQAEKLQGEIEKKKNDTEYKDFEKAKKKLEDAKGKKKQESAKKNLEDAIKKAKNLLADIEKLERLLKYYEGVESLGDIIQNVFDKWKEKYDELPDEKKPKGDDGKPVKEKKLSDVCKDADKVNDWRKENAEELNKRVAIRSAHEKYEKEVRLRESAQEKLKKELTKKKALFADQLKKLDNGELISLQDICDILNRQKKDFVEIKKKN